MPHFLLLYALLLSATPNHAFHTSVTQMQFNAAEKSFEISVRLFTDDLEDALSRDNGGQKISLAKTPKADALIERYVRQHVVLTIGSQSRKAFRYVGHETENDAQWIYLEMPFAEPFRNVMLQQNVLMEVFDDQVNLVNLTYAGQKKTLVYRKSQPVQPVKLSE
jgi:hypothetical protein